MSTPPLPSPPPSPPSDPAPRRFLNRTVVGIVLATFFSDFSHEMATAVLPLYLASVGLGAAALGFIEGIADFVVSLSKLGGGILGHVAPAGSKRPLAAAGYLVTALATSAIGLVTQAWSMVALRCLAWSARGFRGPLRDHLLADAVEPTHYGRVYGLERAGDMAGAVAGPLLAALLIVLGVKFQSVILIAFAPGVLAAASMFFLARERRDGRAETKDAKSASAQAPKKRFPRLFWFFIVGAMLFGIGDFSRTFLILLAARGLGENAGHAGSALAGGGHLSIAILLYAMHNAISALAAYPIGHLGDRRRKIGVLVAGYALGMVTNLVLALFMGSIGWVVAAIALSAVYIAVEETMEKASAAEFVPRELRSLGFGILACGNAVGDMVSSISVGTLLDAGHGRLAFALAAGFSGLGCLWMAGVSRMKPATPAGP